MTLNQSMNIALNSMKNNQYALSVVSHNIANLNTEGYHRQRVNFSENAYLTNCENAIMTIRGMDGASIDSLTGFIDEGAFKDLIEKNSDAEYYNNLSGIFDNLEGITDELGENGLSALLNEFYVSASNLEKYPTDMAIRQQFLFSAENVCEKFNYISDKFDVFEENQYNNLQMDVTTVNNLLSELADANKAHITNNQSDATKAQIDNIVSKLSNYMNIVTDTNKNGSINVYVGGVAVVQGSELKNTLECGYDSSLENPLNIHLKANDGSGKTSKDISSSFTSGSLRAYTEVLNGTNKSITTINDIKASIDKAAGAFAQALNDIQTYSDGTVFAASITADESGEMILEQATNPLITSKDGSSTINAKNIQVNSDVMDDPFLVAAARIDTSKYEDDSWKKSIGNSDNAAAFSALRNGKIIEYDDGIKTTLSDYLVTNAANIGMNAANISSKADLYQDMADSAAANYSNLIGVNLDEELADMIRYQRSFEASARVFAAANDIMDTILNMV